MIRMENVSYEYERRGEPVLKNINLEIEKGEHVFIIGPNGCGKTTLIKHLNALLVPIRGDVWIDDMNTKDSSALSRIRQKVGMVFQNPDSQLVGMSVEEDVAFGPGNLSLAPTTIRERVESSLAVVGLEEYGQKAPHTLSSGQKQLVALAGVLAMRPVYIALDEPTSFLDPSGRRKVLHVIEKLNKDGTTMIHVTHDMDEAVRADRIIVMNEGRILAQEKPAPVFSKFEWLKALGLEVPKITELMWHLKEMGISVRPDILTLNEACIELSKLIRTNHPNPIWDDGKL